MLATILIHVPLAVLPLVQLPQPTRDCQLEVLAPEAIEERSLAEFEARVQAHAALHRRIVRWMGPGATFDDEGGFVADELRMAIVAARPQARQGDFFGPAVAAFFRSRIDRALLRGMAGVAAPLYEPLAGEPAPTINTPFPIVSGSVDWVALFVELPPLPRELAYALWGRDLVLIDAAANLVLDVLPDALPAGAGPGVIYQ
jgi:hypothetical protein